MTSVQTTQTAKIARAFALVLALICLWMGTGVALDHTEDFGFLQASQTFHRGPVAETHAAPLIDPLLCLACQWEGIAGSLQTSAMTVPPPPPAALPLSQALPASPLSAAIRHTRSRAPPCVLA